MACDIALAWPNFAKLPHHLRARVFTLRYKRPRPAPPRQPLARPRKRYLTSYPRVSDPVPEPE
jgi:hypothetical protein